jgi:hypothetical protein
MKYDPAAGSCRCNHGAGYLQQEIAAGRPLQTFQENEAGEFVLVCLICLGLWDYEATDRLIEAVMIPERLSIFEPWE